jgi:hypothetical protein
MAFYKTRPTSDNPQKNQILVPIGWHAFVNGPQELRQNIVTMHADGVATPNNLTDGDEVEILGWRPRTRDGIAYQIRRLSDGHAWGIGAPILR